MVEHGQQVKLTWLIKLSGGTVEIWLDRSNKENNQTGGKITRHDWLQSVYTLHGRLINWTCYCPMEKTNHMLLRHLFILRPSVWYFRFDNLLKLMKVDWQRRSAWLADASRWKIIQVKSTRASYVHLSFWWTVAYLIESSWRAVLSRQCIDR